MAKRIFSVGYVFPGGDVEQLDYNEKSSLLDADIIVFQPTLSYDLRSASLFENKHSLSSYDSAAVREQSKHWRQELHDAIDAGKTVFVFLDTPRQVIVDTGNREYSGTGRNRQTTNIVTAFSSYEALPIQVVPTARRGTEVATASDVHWFAPYWHEFKDISPYLVTIKGAFTETIIQTKAGSHIVAALARTAKGAMVLMPPASYDDEAFTDHGEDGQPDRWSEEASRFGSRLASALQAIDKALRGRGLETPTPGWANGERYRLIEEVAIAQEIAKKNRQIERAEQKKRALETSLEDAGKLRGLLFEKGKPLERVVRHALELMGFTVERVAESDSEFDAILTSDEGRFLGEVEGKDNKAINVDKLSQLERNLQEDFQRDEVEEYAIGVLLGNGYRLSPIEERDECFTAKCLSGAARGGIVLVRTHDLFGPARYLRASQDQAYAAACRQALAGAIGRIVSFPPTPSDAIEPSKQLNVS